MNTWLIRGLGVGVFLLVAAAYLWGAGAGRDAAEAECAKEMARIEAANRKAISEAEAALFDLADRLSLQSMELDDAVSASDAATAADPDGGSTCLPPDSVRRLDAIR